MESANFKVLGTTLSQLKTQDDQNLYAIELLVSKPGSDPLRLVIGPDKFDDLYDTLEVKSLNEITYLRLIKTAPEEQYSVIGNILNDKTLSLVPVAE